MVNIMQLLESQVLYRLVRRAGLRHQMVEIEPGSVFSFWLPKETTLNNNNQADDDSTTTKKKKKKKKKDKPAVLLIHGFAGDGIVTWHRQILSLARRYSVYVPDLFFFGRSTTARPERSPEFQAECLAAALGQLGVTRCTVVGFSYGGTVAFKMAEARPDLVRSLVVSGSVPDMTESLDRAIHQKVGFSSGADLLLFDSADGIKNLFAVGAYRKIWMPDFFLRDFFKVMFTNLKERAELMKESVISDKDARTPNLSQSIFLLWGANDKIFTIELGKTIKEQLGEKATLHSIKKAGHVAHMERAGAYNRRLKEILTVIHAQPQDTTSTNGEVNS